MKSNYPRSKGVGSHQPEPRTWQQRSTIFLVSLSASTSIYFGIAAQNEFSEYDAFVRRVLNGSTTQVLTVLCVLLALVTLFGISKYGNWTLVRKNLFIVSTSVLASAVKFGGIYLSRDGSTSDLARQQFTAFEVVNRIASGAPLLCVYVLSACISVWGLQWVKKNLVLGPVKIDTKRPQSLENASTTSVGSSLSVEGVDQLVSR